MFGGSRWLDSASAAVEISPDKVGGFGVGAGGTLRGFAAALVGVGAPGFADCRPGGRGHDVEGGVLAPVYFKIENDGGSEG